MSVHQIETQFNTKTPAAFASLDAKQHFPLSLTPFPYTDVYIVFASARSTSASFRAATATTRRLTQTTRVPFLLLASRERPQSCRLGCRIRFLQAQTKLFSAQMINLRRSIYRLGC